MCQGLCDIDLLRNGKGVGLQKCYKIVNSSNLASEDFSLLLISVQRKNLLRAYFFSLPGFSMFLITVYYSCNSSGDHHVLLKHLNNLPAIVL